jgi:hypothetical protein
MSSKSLARKYRINYNVSLHFGPLFLGECPVGQSLIVIVYSFQRVMHAILSTRIILQTRKAASSTEEQPIEGVSLSDLHFLTTEDFSEGTGRPK